MNSSWLTCLQIAFIFFINALCSNCYAQANPNNPSMLSIQLPHARPILSASVSADGSIVQVAHADATAWHWNIKNGKPVGPFSITEKPLFVQLLPDNRTIAELDAKGVLHFRKTSPESSGNSFSVFVCLRPAHLWILASKVEVLCLTERDMVERWRIVGRRKNYLGVLPAANSKWKFASSGSALIGFHSHSPEMVYLHAHSGLRRISLPASVRPLVAAVSARSAEVALGTAARSICRWSAKSNTLRCTGSAVLKDAVRDRDFGVVMSPYGAIAISSDGNHIVAATSHHLTFARHADGAIRLTEIPHTSFDIAGILFSNEKALIVKSREITIADPLTTKQTGAFAILRADAWSGTWAVLSSEGLFDTGDIESARDLFSTAHEDPAGDAEIRRLMFPDRRDPAPLRVRISPMLGVSAYIRDYFMPGLLSQILMDRLSAAPFVRPVTSLNRALPKIQIKEAVSCVEQACAGRSALVTITAKPEQGFVSRNGAITEYETGVYDLRLFRNGQLVGQWPEPKVGIGGPQDIAQWRAASRVPIDAGQSQVEHTFRVALPSIGRGMPVVFTAYAFNEDRVRSATATLDKLQIPENMPVRTPKAYVVAVGVDRYDLESRTLSFAAKDARDLSAALSRIKGHEVVPLTLVSQHTRGKIAATDQATKANIRSVLDLLAGKSETERERLKSVAGIDQRVVEQLRKATPDDVVILAFSGHGYTDPSNGQFYLLPSDSGEAPGFGPDVLSKFMSSEELAQWLREVGAGQMAMIIDACHSAGAVDMPGFKPGPLGDRGLGQLAYDKGMMILAATQASNVALESNKIQQGLLTYALVADGFKERALNPRRRNADIDNDGLLTLKEWLQYGERRVPGLYEDISAGKLNLVPRDPTPLARDWKATTVRTAQTPSLFDFQRTSIIVELGNAATK